MRRIRLFVFIVCAVLLLNACKKQETGAAPEPSAEILTGIFTETTVSTESGTRMCYGVTPRFDPASQVCEVFCQTQEEREENGEIFLSYRSFLCSFTSGGELLGTEEITLPDDGAVVSLGTVKEDAVYVLLSSVRQDTLVRLDRSDGAAVSEELRSYFEESRVCFFAADKDGLLYVSDGEATAVFDGTFKLLHRIAHPTEITSMARGADGLVRAVSGRGGKSVVLTLDGDEESETISFPDDGRHTLIPSATGMPLVSFFYENGHALLAAREENGALIEREILNFTNSGISGLGAAQSGYTVQTGLCSSAMLTEDLFLSADCDASLHASPVLWRKGDDVHTDEIRILTLAHTETLPPRMVTQLTDFNRSHPEVQIVAVDYTQYIDPQSLDAQEGQLVFDILNSGFRPDIIMTSADPGAPLSERRVPVQLTERNLAIDLTPYLSADPEIGFEELFGCVPRLFDDGRGGIWGVTPAIQIDTLLLSPALKDSLRRQDGWTFREMTDLFDALPEDADGVFMQNQSWAVWPWNILPRGYVDFMGKDGDGFLSDDFLAYLAFLNDLPKDLNGWYATPHGSTATDYREKERAFMNGEIAADRGLLRAMADTTVQDWYREEILLIGYPADGFSGIRVSTECAFIITAFADDPDLCFEAVKAFFTPGTYDFNNGANNPIPSTKSHYLEVRAEFRGEEAGADEATEWFFDILDGAGVPYLSGTPQAVHDIAVEEITAYLEGMGSAEDCAAKIASRVGLWAAERR